MRTLISLSLLLGLIACESDSSGSGGNITAPQPPGPRRAAGNAVGGGADAGGADPLADMDAPAYTYNPIGKRDPFRSFFQGADDGGITNPTPLQRFEVDQYVVTAIVWGVSQPKAMLEDPEGTGHVVQNGTYIGKNWGKVTAITSTSVVITEEFQNIDGELVTNQLTLDLPVDELEL
ncbi:MAG: pilus assembly protein PilP [Myxococcota bacterium]|nr:pilus assembly protein PilP [Myxococcota bacterium]